MPRQDTWCRSAADARPVPPFRYRILPRSPIAKPHVVKCDFPTHAMHEAFVDSGTVMEGTKGGIWGWYGPTARPYHPIVPGPRAIRPRACVGPRASAARIPSAHRRKWQHASPGGSIFAPEWGWAQCISQYLRDARDRNPARVGVWPSWQASILPHCVVARVEGIPHLFFAG